MALSHGIHAGRLIGWVVLATALVPLGSFGQQGSTAMPRAAPPAALPFELRAVAARYPVTLYATRSCAACDAGRALLRQRGVPHAERLVADGDGDLLQRLTGGRELPALTIGSQSLRGFAAEQWSAYLDAAGYPRQSRLPAAHPAAMPVQVPLGGSSVAPPDASRAPEPNTDSGAGTVTPAARSDSPLPAPPPGGIRF